MAKCYILASMSNELQHQHQYYTIASDILFNLKEMFRSQGRLARQRALRDFLKAKMAEGTPVFAPNKQKQTGKKKPKSPKVKQGPTGGGVGKVKGKTKASKAGKGKCFQCGETGHWKRNCPKVLAKKQTGMTDIQVIEVSFIVDTSSTWCLDSGATHHICNSLQRFQVSRQLEEGKISLSLGSEAKVLTVAVGVIRLCFQNNNVLILNNALYVPSIRRNLISVPCLASCGYTCLFGRDVVIEINGNFVCSGILSYGL
ncbi:uncharacterized protein A4U43_C10F6140 [Asparagus officinalis]|uniref:CCHC-type domain-containing protein n=1 Tax=Asparagus officinalis TaxID=4686 RepID=A0A5P1E5H5_ASPOF|nr:uncharacterized protein A4U43_C10F6140 [Asparagus officinalis]